MRTTRWLRLAVLAAGAVAATAVTATGAAPASAAAPVRIVDLGTLGAPCCSYATAINDRGQVVGASAIGPDEFSAQHAFRWERGRMTDLGTLGSSPSVAAAINERGDIVVGWSGVSPGDYDTTHAVAWRGGHAVDLGTLGGSRSYAMGVNDAGTVVGISETAAGELHAFRWERGRMTDLAPAGSYSLANAINERGDIAGTTATDMTDAPVRWRDGSVTVLPVPAGEYGATTTAIDNRGDVAGYSFGPTGNAAFRWAGRQVTALGLLPGATFATATGMNDRGEVVGYTDHTAFAWQHGRMTGLPGLVRSAVARDVNNSGQVVGESATIADGSNPHAVLWTR